MVVRAAREREAQASTVRLTARVKELTRENRVLSSKVNQLGFMLSQSYAASVGAPVPDGGAARKGGGEVRMPRCPSAPPNRAKAAVATVDDAAESAKPNLALQVRALRTNILAAHVQSIDWARLLRRQGQSARQRQARRVPGAPQPKPPAGKGGGGSARELRARRPATAPARRSVSMRIAPARALEACV